MRQPTGLLAVFRCTLTRSNLPASMALETYHPLQYFMQLGAVHARQHTAMRLYSRVHEVLGQVCSCVCIQHPPGISIWSCSVRWYLYRGRAHHQSGPAACMTSSMLVALALLHDVDKRKTSGTYGFDFIDLRAPEAQAIEDDGRTEHPTDCHGRRGVAAQLSVCDPRHVVNSTCTVSRYRVRFLGIQPCLDTRWLFGVPGARYWEKASCSTSCVCPIKRKTLP